MKRSSTVIFAALLAVTGMLTACGGKNTMEGSTTDPDTGAAAVTETEKAPATDDTAGTESSTEASAPDLVFKKRNWRLTFADEFDGDGIDGSKWAQIPDWDRGTYIWMPEAARVENGNLILSVREGKDGKYYTGGIRTLGKFSQAYGYYEIRCKLPTVAGVNDAFWLMGGNMSDAAVEGATDGSEIDIFETNGFSVDRVQHALHWDGYGDDHGTVYCSVDGKNLYDGEFHTFGFIWDKTVYRFYIDGELTWSECEGGICKVPLYLKLTAAVGGWVGDIDPSLVPIDVMTVDYVRVYEEIK